VNEMHGETVKFNYRLFINH